MSKPRNDQRDVASLLRRLTALKSQLPDRERALLSSTIAAAVAAGVLTQAAAAQAQEAARPTDDGAGQGSVLEQFAEAFMPGAIDEFGRVSVKLPD